MTAYEIRRATRADAAELVAMEKQTFGNRSWGANGVEGGFEEAGVEFLIASRDGDEPIGFAIWRALPGEAELLSIGVVENARRLGAGAALLSAVIDAARAAGAEAIFLEVDPANEPAVHLYRIQGFEHAARRKAYYRTGADALIMRKGL